MGTIILHPVWRGLRKGLDALRLQQWDDAAGAIEAWNEAQSSDPKYVKPYENLTAFGRPSGKLGGVRKVFGLVPR